MQISVRCVLPVRSVNRLRKMRSTVQGAMYSVGPGVRHLIEGDLELIQRVGARFIHARMLAGGADEEPGEKIRERGMVLPEANQTAQQIGTPQKGAVRRSDAADDDVIAAAGAGVAAVEHEFFGAQTRLARQMVKLGGIFHQFPPRLGGMNIHFDHARVGRHFDHRNPRIEGRRVALDRDRHPKIGRRVLDRGDQVEIVAQKFDGRQEDVSLPSRTWVHRAGRETQAADSPFLGIAGFGDRLRISERRAAQ